VHSQGPAPALLVQTSGAQVVPPQQTPVPPSQAQGPVQTMPVQLAASQLTPT
jgi:hypothetical protein